MKRQTRAARRRLFCCSLFARVALCAPALAQQPADQGPVTVTQDDADAIKNILVGFRRHVDEVKLRSDPGPYLDCEENRALRGYGLKAVPFLIEQVARIEAANAYRGAALIDEEGVKTPEEVYSWNRRRKTHAQDGTLALWLLDNVLTDLISSDMEDEPVRGNGGYTEVFGWMHWWDRHKHRFVFEGGDPPAIPLPKRPYPRGPAVVVTAHDGLLDVSAAGVSYRRIIERAVAALGVTAIFGQQDYIDVVTSIEMRSVTFDEFMYLLGRSVSMAGFGHSKTDTGFRVGR